MSAWDRAAMRQAMGEAIYASAIPDGWKKVDKCLDAIAPHLAALKAETWAQACEAAAKLLEMHASLVSVQNVDEPVHAAILEAADNYMRETADVIRNLTPPQPQSGGTDADDWMWRRFGSDHEKPCKLPYVTTCARPECQRANECQGRCAAAGPQSSGEVHASSGSV